MSDPESIDEELVDLALEALDHAAESVSAGGTLIPFAIEVINGEKTLHRHVAETFEESVEMALLSLKGRGDLDAAVVAYDGYLTVDGERTDAVFARVQACDQDSSLVFAQRYRPKRGLKRFKPLGNPAFLGDEESLFS